MNGQESDYFGSEYWISEKLSDLVLMWLQVGEKRLSQQSEKKEQIQ